MSVTVIEGRKDERRKVLIAGGGVAGVEALLAFAALAPGRVSVELMAPEPDFAYRPLSVAEPFEVGAVQAAVAGGAGGRARCALPAGCAWRRSTPDRRVVITRAGEELDYDFLLLAIGARATVALPGALTFRGPPDVEAFAELLGRLERGVVKRVVFAVPHAGQVAAADLRACADDRGASRGARGAASRDHGRHARARAARRVRARCERARSLACGCGRAWRSSPPARRPRSSRIASR